jgi:hypothetical protein
MNKVIYDLTPMDVLCDSDTCPIAVVHSHVDLFDDGIALQMAEHPPGFFENVVPKVLPGLIKKLHEKKAI